MMNDIALLKVNYTFEEEEILHPCLPVEYSAVYKQVINIGYTRKPLGAVGMGRTHGSRK